MVNILLNIVAMCILCHRLLLVCQSGHHLHLNSHHQYTVNHTHNGHNITHAGVHKEHDSLVLIFLRLQRYNLHLT